jgi:transcriptional regulator with XRE-family HTH domain
MAVQRLTRQQIRENRKRLGLSQAELGERVGAHQVHVSNWEIGKAVPTPDERATLLKLFNADASAGISATPQASYGDWVSEAREAKGLNRKELAAKVGISEIQVYDIETGRTLNPRDSTRRALNNVLGPAPRRVDQAVQKAAEIAGVGRLTDFNPHDEYDFPTEPGVYVFYDVSERPIYVGQSGSIKTRIRSHLDKFWYKSPIVETAAYVKVDDANLRKQLEETLISSSSPTPSSTRKPSTASSARRLIASLRGSGALFVWRGEDLT